MYRSGAIWHDYFFTIRIFSIKDLEFWYDSKLLPLCNTSITKWVWTSYIKNEGTKEPLCSSVYFYISIVHRSCIIKINSKLILLKSDPVHFLKNPVIWLRNLSYKNLSHDTNKITYQKMCFWSFLVILGHSWQDQFFTGSFTAN